MKTHAPLKTFTAIEIKPGETAHGVVGLFVKSSAQKGILFETLDFLGVIRLGSTKYIRFRTDSATVTGILNRNVVTFAKGEYKVLTPEGNFVGRLSCTTMQAPADPTLRREYRGPKLQYWDRQFS
jgi:hypothetical protein